MARQRRPLPWRNRRAHVLLFLAALLRFHDNNTTTTLAWYITAPTLVADWEQLAALLVESFHAPPSNAPFSAQTLRWNLFEKALTEQQTYQQYVGMARKMKGKKYSLLLVKADDDDLGRQQVLAVAEMGISRRGGVHKTASDIKVNTNRDGNDENDTDDASSSSSTRATIGVLCVDKQHRHGGLGKALVQRCEDIALQVWKEEQIYAEVDVENIKALQFFKLCGFIDTTADDSDENENHDANNVMVSVRKSRRLEQRPHKVLSKTLHDVLLDPLKRDY